MSIRNICVLSLLKEDSDEILLYKIFPTVEKRCKNLYGDSYNSLPHPRVFVNSLLVKLGLTVDSNQYVECRDKASRIMQLPVVEVNIGSQEIWPVVAIVQKPFLVSCLPLIEGVKEPFSKESKKNLLQHSSISVGFTVLLGILDFLGQTFFSEKASKLKELENFLTLSMPFGTPSDVEPSCTAYLHSFHSSVFLKRQPAWKPFDYKGKQQIHLQMQEFVRCMQSDHSGSICHLEIFGQVFVKADLEDSMNAVTISVTNADASHPLLLDSLLIHPCVQMHSGPSISGSSLLKRLRFSPPSYEFILFHYCTPEPKEPPIQGVFKMLGENSVELLIQLKLSEKIKNSFEYCDVILVFYNRGPVKNFDFNSYHGIVKLSDDKHSLKWSIGTKFPKDLEAAITAKLDFLEKPKLPNSDPFCVDKNCYVQINFKQNNSTLSGCYIDPKTVSVSQGSKAKILIDRSVQSSEYRIWNNYGDLPYPVNISNKFETLFV